MYLIVFTSSLFFLLPTVSLSLVVSVVPCKYSWTFYTFLLPYTLTSHLLKKKKVAFDQISTITYKYLNSSYIDICTLCSMCPNPLWSIHPAIRTHACIKRWRETLEVTQHLRNVLRRAWPWGQLPGSAHTSLRPCSLFPSVHVCTIDAVLNAWDYLAFNAVFVFLQGSLSNSPFKNGNFSRRLNLSFAKFFV